MIDDDLTGKRLLFIGGLHRSGTSPLARALGMHPQVSVFENTGVPEDEGQHLQDTYPSAREIGGIGLFGFSPQGWLTERSPLATTRTASQLLHSWRQHWDLERAILVEKSPPNLIRSRFLGELFPGARFVMVIRHPAAVALASRKWSVASMETLLSHWLTCHRLLAEDAAGCSTVVVVRYEDLVERPTATLDALSTFVGLEHVPINAVWRSGVNERYFRLWRRQRFAWSLRRRRFMRRLESSFNLYGYSLDELDWRGPTNTLPLLCTKGDTAVTRQEQ